MGGRGKIFLKNGLLLSVLQVGDRNGACHGHGGDSEEGEAERVVFPAVADEEGDAPGGKTKAIEAACRNTPQSAGMRDTEASTDMRHRATAWSRKQALTVRLALKRSAAHPAAMTMTGMARRDMERPRLASSGPNPAALTRKICRIL